MPKFETPDQVRPQESEKPRTVSDDMINIEKELLEKILTNLNSSFESYKVTKAYTSGNELAGLDIRRKIRREINEIRKEFKEKINELPNVENKDKVMQEVMRRIENAVYLEMDKY